MHIMSQEWGIWLGNRVSNFPVLKKNWNGKFTEQRVGRGRDKHTTGPRDFVYFISPWNPIKILKEGTFDCFRQRNRGTFGTTDRIQTSVCHARTCRANLSHDNFRHVRRWSLAARQNISNDYGTKFMCFEWAKTAVQVSDWRSSCSNNYNIFIIVSRTGRHCERHNAKITAWERGWSLTCPRTWQIIGRWEFHCFDILVGSSFLLAHKRHKKYGVTSWSCKSVYKFCIFRFI